jgi:hypothetical protein
MAVQDLDEARHVSALEIMRQIHIHLETGDRVLLAPRSVLDPHGVENVLDPHLIDGNLA